MPWKDPEKMAQAMLLAAVATGAGLLDYLYALNKRRIAWSIGYFFLHLALAGFSGWLAGMSANALGYGWEAQLAAAGLAGFMNVRALELAETFFGKRADK